MALAIKNFLDNYIQKNDSWKFQLIRNWSTIIGNLSSKATLEKIEHDVITIGVYDSCWMQELYLLSPVLLATINKTLDEPRIKQIRFKRAVAFKAKTLKKISLSTASIQNKYYTCTAIESLALKNIKDEELKQALLAYLSKCKLL